ncbi:MAG: biotin-dependent carboxyltransferase family protein [Verrucomicrobiota bacterium]
MKVARVQQTGLAAGYQDTGRPGWRRFGVPTGGFMDGHSASLANKLLDNTHNETVLEFALHGAEIEFLQDTWIALAGACSSQLLKAGSARLVHAGESLSLSPAPAGIWTYLAIPGGWQAQTWFGSTSTHSRSCIGDRIQNGDILKSCTNRLAPFESSVVTRLPTNDHTIDLAPPPDGFPILPGPQYSSFPSRAQEALTHQKWQISSQSDRAGYRLQGHPLDLADEITSEPVLPGSFQVPGNGQPIITMPDGPTVGGYPKIAYMEHRTLWRLAQCQPGSQVEFRWEK